MPPTRAKLFTKNTLTVSSNSRKYFAAKVYSYTVILNIRTHEDSGVLLEKGGCLTGGNRPGHPQGPLRCLCSHCV